MSSKQSIIVFFLFLCFLVKPCEQKIVIHTAQEKKIQGQLEELPESFFLEQVSYTADVPFEKKEFEYLIDLPVKTEATRTQLYKALFYLVRKNKFENIIVTFAKQACGYTLHFEFISYWTLRAVKIHGPLFGKDRYRNYYLLESGEIFDKQKHHHSLNLLQEALYKEGYCAARVTDTMVYDECAKTVTVHLKLHRGKHYTIKTVSISASAQETDHELTLKLQAMANNLKHSFYYKEAIDKLAAEMRSYLIVQGYLASTIELTTDHDHVHKTTDLCFTVKVCKRKKLSFSGNTFFTQAQLQKRLVQFAGALYFLPPEILVQELKVHYGNHGFINVEISYQEEKHALHFFINEGERALISAVEIEGAVLVNTNQLRKKLGLLSFKPQVFDDQLLRDLYKNCSEYYQSEGFWHITVTHELRRTARGSHAIKLTICENEKSEIAAVVFDESLASTAIDKDCFKGTYTSDTLAQQQEYLSNLFANSELYSEVAHEHTKVTIFWKVNTKQKYFGKTVFLGTNTLPFDYIMNELRYQQGQQWNATLVKKSMAAVRELDMFDQLHLYPYQAEVPFDEQPILLKMIQDDPFELRLRTGIGFEYAGVPFTYEGVTYKGGGAMVFKNPFNRADYFFANVDFTQTHRIMQTGYWTPWIFGHKIQTEVNLYSNAFEYAGMVGKQNSLYTVTQQGGMLGLVQRWRLVEFGFNTGIEWMETKISNKKSQKSLFNLSVARALNFEPALLDKQVPYFILEPTVFYDSLDNQLYPTTGSMTVVSVKGMLPLGVLDETFFIKLLAEESLFIPLKKTVLALRARFGHIVYKKFEAIMPSERFYLGGSHSIRSYQTDMCPPLGIVFDGNGEKTFVPQGGKSMLNGNIELRFPVYKQLWGVVFQDFGFLNGTGLHNLMQGSLLAGTGFGIRLNTPVGPLRFDIGFKWSRPDKSIPLFAWFLTLGQPF